MIDICSTFENAARVGSQTERQSGRPGLNPLRFSEKYTITEKHAQDLAKIAEVTGINGLRDLHRQEQPSHSLYEIPEVYRSVLPYFEICQGKCTHLELLPVELGMDRENAEKKYSIRGRRKNSRKNCRISHPREQETWNRMGIQRRKDCTSCVKNGK